MTTNTMVTEENNDECAGAVGADERLCPWLLWEGTGITAGGKPALCHARWGSPSPAAGQGTEPRHVHTCFNTRFPSLLLPHLQLQCGVLQARTQRPSCLPQLPMRGLFDILKMSRTCPLLPALPPLRCSPQCVLTLSVPLSPCGTQGRAGSVCSAAMATHTHTALTSGHVHVCSWACIPHSALKLCADEPCLRYPPSPVQAWPYRY